MPLQYGDGTTLNNVSSVLLGDGTTLNNVVDLFFPEAGDATPFTSDGDSDALALRGFLVSDAEVTIMIAASGVVTVSGVLASDLVTPVTVTTTADFQSTSPVHVATNRDVTVNITVPSGFANTGAILTETLTVSQTVDASDTCSIGPFVNTSISTGACNAAGSASDTANPCSSTTTTSGTFSRTQNQVRTVTRVINGLADLINPCAGVSTTNSFALTRGSCTNSGATNTAFVSGNSSNTVTGTPTAQVETITNTGTCTVTNTSVGCCPASTCSGAGTQVVTFNLSASTRVDVTTVTRNCDGAVLSTTPNTVTVTAASTGNTRTQSCTGTYPNPASCIPTIFTANIRPGGGTGCLVDIVVSDGSNFNLFQSNTSGCLFNLGLGSFASGTTINTGSGFACASVPSGPNTTFNVTC